MYDLAKLCDKISMPGEVTKILLSVPTDDHLGFQTLHTHLNAACTAWERYQQLGIPEDIYIATMGAFSRFVREHMASFGHYGFDRGFWTTRQTGCVLFRIGQLEYELFEEAGKRCISLHIPSDADLSLSCLRESWEQAKPLLESAFPDYAAVPWFCHSWLLSPDLAQLLPASSRILAFQQSFSIQPDSEDGECKLWVYGREDIPHEDLPENTTLQQNLKTFLLAGHAFRSGIGILKADPFR